MASAPMSPKMEKEQLRMEEEGLKDMVGEAAAVDDMLEEVDRIKEME